MQMKLSNWWDIEKQLIKRRLWKRVIWSFKEYIKQLFI